MKRKQLADDNKVFKYLKYALGEIILVVIGILIALQINNWNQKKMEHALEGRYLKRLQNELTQDTTYLNSTIEVTNSELKNIIRELRMAYEIKNTKEEINKLLSLQSFFAEALILNKATYEDLLSTQNLNIIKTDSLRFLIVDYYRNAEKAAKAIDNFNQIAYDMQIQYFSAIPVAKYYPWNLGLLSDENLHYNKDFSFIGNHTSYEFKMMESFQILFLNKHQYLIHFYQDLKIRASGIIHLIDKELE